MFNGHQINVKRCVSLKEALVWPLFPHTPTAAKISLEHQRKYFLLFEKGEYKACVFFLKSQWAVG